MKKSLNVLSKFVHKIQTLCAFIFFLFGHHISWKIGKVEKEKAFNHHKQESNKTGCVGKIFTYHRHIQNPVKHLRWSILQTWLIIFGKSSILGADYTVENFSLGWNFNLLNRDEISSHMISENNVNIGLRLYVKNSSR